MGALDVQLTTEELEAINEITQRIRATELGKYSLDYMSDRQG